MDARGELADRIAGLEQRDAAEEKHLQLLLRQVVALQTPLRVCPGPASVAPFEPTWPPRHLPPEEENVVPMADRDALLRILRALDEAGGPDTRRAVVLNAAGRYRFSCSQLGEILGFLRFPAELDFAVVALRNRVTDRENWRALDGYLPFVVRDRKLGIISLLLASD